MNEILFLKNPFYISGSAATWAIQIVSTKYYEGLVLPLQSGNKQSHGTKHPSEQK